MKNNIENRTALKRGQIRFYFPEHPNHPLNGATFQHCGGYVGKYGGLNIRTQISTFPASDHNQNSPSGFWEGELKITAEDFNSDMVLVKFSHMGDSTANEMFFLTKAK